MKSEGLLEIPFMKKQIKREKTAEFSNLKLLSLILRLFLTPIIIMCKQRKKNAIRPKIPIEPLISRR
jgi:hypothetical protein